MIETHFKNTPKISEEFVIRFILADFTKITRTAYFTGEFEEIIICYKLSVITANEYLNQIKTA